MKLKNLSTTAQSLPEDLAQFRSDVLNGLHRSPKDIPCKYLYDERGSQLFDQICELQEYYPTRTELAILEQHASAMANQLGDNCLLIEYGSGSSLKTRLLLDRIAEDLAGYVPVDISREHLENSAETIARQYPGLQVLPVAADFTEPFEVPDVDPSPARRVAYFPGSTIGNFEPAAARNLLAGMAKLCGPGGGLLLGVDLKKDVHVLERAYNDASGVTAEFTLNLLRRMNQELGADFDLNRFEHTASWNDERGCVELFLVSTHDQEVHLAGERISFQAGERLRTERSHKYTVEEFSQLVAPIGWKVELIWTDEQNLFSVQYLTTTSITN